MVQRCSGPDKQSVHPCKCRKGNRLGSLLYPWCYNFSKNRFGLFRRSNIPAWHGFPFQEQRFEIWSFVHSKAYQLSGYSYWKSIYGYLGRFFVSLFGKGKSDNCRYTCTGYFKIPQNSFNTRRIINLDKSPDTHYSYPVVKHPDFYGWDVKMPTFVET